MKKVLLTSLLCICTLSTAIVCACTNNEQENPNKIPAGNFEEVDLDEIYFGSDSVSLPIGETYQVKISTDKTVAWSVENPQVATVSETGLVTALAEGRTMVYATVGENVYSCLIVVEPIETYFSLKLDKTNIPEFTIGSQMQINTIVESSGIENVELAWSSSDEGILSVLSSNNDGCVIQANASGTATLTASFENCTAVCTVTVIGETEKQEPDTVKVISGLEDIKPSWNDDYHQQYKNNSHFITEGNYIIPSVGNTTVEGKEVSYQIDFDYSFKPAISYFRPGFGFKISLEKEELEYHKLFSGFTRLEVDVMLSTSVTGDATDTSHTRYIDVLSGFENGVGQYTRYAISNYTWYTFSFDIDFIIENYDKLMDTEFDSGYVLFTTTSEKNLNSLPANVTPSADCAKSVSGGNIGTVYTIYFGDIAFSNVVEETPDDNPDNPDVNEGNVVSGIEDIKPSWGEGYHQKYENSSDYVTDGTHVVVSKPEAATVEGKQVSYQITYDTPGLGYFRQGFGFAISLTKEELQAYKQEGITQLNVDVLLHFSSQYGEHKVYTRYLDVLYGYQNGVGQYTRYAVNNYTWYTFAFDIDMIIENYDLFTNTAFKSGYVLFANTNEKDLNSLPANVTVSDNCPASVSGGNSGTAYTFYLGEISFVDPDSEWKEIYGGKTSVNAINGVEGIKPSFDAGTYNQKYNDNSDFIKDGNKIVASVGAEQIGGKDVSYKITHTLPTNYNSGSFGIQLSFTKDDLINYKKYSNLTQLKIDIFAHFASVYGEHTVYTRYIDVLTGFNAQGEGLYTRYAINNYTWATFIFDIDFIIDNYDLFTNTAKGSGYTLFVFAKDTDLSLLGTESRPNVTASANCPASVSGGNFGGNWTVYFGDIILQDPEAELRAQYGNKTSVNAVSGATNIKPSWSEGYQQKYYNGSDYVTDGTHVVVSQPTETTVEGKAVSYQIDYSLASGLGYTRSNFGIQLSLTKEELINYKKYSGLKELKVDVFMHLNDWEEYTVYTRYIDVLTGFNAQGEGLYTRYTVKHYTWTTFTFDIDMIIENYELFTNTAFNSGYAMFVMTNDKNLDKVTDGTRPNVTAIEGCANSVNGGNMGIEYMIYFGDIQIV